MANDPSEPDHIRSARFASVVGDVIGGACVGAFAGYAYNFIPQLISPETVQAFGSLLGWNIVPVDPFWLPVALGAAVGIVGAVIWGQASRSWETRRSAGLREAAASLGASLSASPDPGLSEKLGRLFPTGTLSGMDNVIRTQVQGIRFAVSDVSVTRETGSGTDDRTRTVTTQTAAYYESDTLRFPSFTLQPEGLMTKLFSLTTGFEDINFPAHPDFSRAYYLRAVRVADTRKLFNSQLLEALGRHQGLQVTSDLGGLVFFRPGKLCDAGELKGFISEAAEIFRLFEASARQSNLTAEAASSAKVDIRARAGEVPGPIGKILRENLVTRADVDAFISQPPPRTIPPNLLAYRNREAPPWLIGLGVLFALVGALLMVGQGYQALSDSTGRTGISLGATLFALLFLVAGAGITFFSVPACLRLTRLLRYGNPATATIEKISSTNWTDSGEDVVQVTARYNAAGRVVQGTCQITGSALKRAQQLAPDAKSVLILHDPADPQRVLLVEQLQNEEEAERFTR